MIESGLAFSKTSYVDFDLVKQGSHIAGSAHIPFK